MRDRRGQRPRYGGEGCSAGVGGAGDAGASRAVTAHLHQLGVSWVAEPKERPDGFFATLTYPDGNYIQVLQMNEAHLAARNTRTPMGPANRRP